MVGAVFYCTPLLSQKTITKKIDFEIKEYELTEKHHKLLLKHFDKLKVGDELELILYTSEEKKLDKPAYLLKATKIRAELISKFLLDHTIATQENFSIKYEETTKKQTMSGSNASYREFSSHQISPISLIVTKPQLLKIYTSNELFDTTFNYSKINLCRDDVSPNDGEYFYGKGYYLFVPYGAINKTNCENCEITVKHNYFSSVSDILARDLTTTSNGKILVTAGMFFIEAYCGDKKLSLNEDGKIILYFGSWENDDDFTYKAFSGKRRNKIVDWEENGDNIEEFDDYEGEGEGEYGYQFLIDATKLGWINCDAFYEVKDKVDLIVKTEMTYSPSVRMIFKERKSILPGYSLGKSNEIHFNDVPNGEEVSILSYAFSKDKKKVKWALESTTLAKGEKMELKLTNESTQEEFKKMLAEQF